MSARFCAFPAFPEVFPRVFYYLPRSATLWLELRVVSDYEVIPCVFCHNTQLVGWNCVSCPIMRTFLALSATKRNLMVGIARRGWKAWWNVTKRTATRIS